MEKENKKVTRRKFLEDSSTKALAGTAAAFFGLGMIRPKPVHAAGCWPWCALGCSNQCSGCSNSCSESCTGSCGGNCSGSCSGSCTGYCQIECHGTCSGGCTVSGQRVSAAESVCGTPVPERTSSDLHVTV